MGTGTGKPNTNKTENHAVVEIIKEETMSVRNDVDGVEEFKVNEKLSEKEVDEDARSIDSTDSTDTLVLLQRIPKYAKENKQYNQKQIEAKGRKEEHVTCSEAKSIVNQRQNEAKCGKEELDTCSETKCATNQKQNESKCGKEDTGTCSKTKRDASAVETNGKKTTTLSGKIHIKDDAADDSGQDQKDKNSQSNLAVETNEKKTTTLSSKVYKKDNAAYDSDQGQINENLVVNENSENTGTSVDKQQHKSKTNAKENVENCVEASVIEKDDGISKKQLIEPVNAKEKTYINDETETHVKEEEKQETGRDTLKTIRPTTRAIKLAERFERVVQLRRRSIANRQTVILTKVGTRFQLVTVPAYLPGQRLYRTNSWVKNYMPKEFVQRKKKGKLLFN